MSKRNDGGPAFPGKRFENVSSYIGDQEVKTAQEISYPGMSLRDYFAAKAMQGLLASETARDPDRMRDADHVAKYSYEQADAMLAEREK